MAKIFLFRHAQTFDNENRIFSGWRDTDLNPAGIDESKEVMNKLLDESPNKAYTSDLIRCIHTLEIVLEPHNGVQVYIDPRLRERDYGSLTGRNKEEVAKEFPLEYPDWHRSYSVAPPNGESIGDVDKRVNEFLDDLKNSMRPNDVIFICAHGNSMRPIRGRFENLTNEQSASFEHTPGEIFEYTLDDS